MKKDTIYVDADDEISEVADKVVSSKAKVVALVLPKRCTMLHSVVNTKILNKAAKNAGKQIVLITSEKAIMPIAGASGVYVAKTLKSKPEIPSVAPEGQDVSEEAVEVEETPLDPNKSIGELSGDEPLEIDEAKDDEPQVTPGKKVKKDKKLAVPNFDSFRAKLFLGIGGLIAFLALFYVAAFVLPKAEITIEAERQSIPLDIEFTAGPDLENNVDQKTFTLETKSQEKSESKKAAATGERNDGKKASGTVVFYNCSVEDKLDEQSRTIPAGTGISSGSNTFITQSQVTVQPSGFTGGGSTCKFDKPSAEVTVIAQNPGESYNAQPGNYKVNGFATMIAEDSDGMTGGTDNKIKIVDQADCDALKSSLVADSSSNQVKDQLLIDFETGGISASLDTFKAETISNNCEPAVGQQANEVTAKATFRYTLSGVSTKDLTELVNKEAQAKVGDDLTIIDSGLSEATIVVDSQNSGVITMTVKTTAIAGINQDENKIKESIAGKNARETSDIVKQINGIKDVQVKYSPFWVNKTPSNKDSITLVFKDNNE